MIKINLILSSAAMAILYSGCAMMPYKDDFSCLKGKNNGVCASVSEVYEMSNDDLDALQKKRIGENDCNKCKDKDQKEMDKLQYETEITKENQKLKDIIEAVELQKITREKSIIIEIDKNQYKSAVYEKTKLNECSKTNGTDTVIQLNKIVKVCVANANIRQAPSCEAKILRVAKRGEELYAKYEKNGWIRIEDGYIHKSIVK
ncbi:TraV family lipoprotein [Nitrosophilus labii]|uniref:TraV family lipoprotein n=1 Tax=Nitrosophilus labii TaxID=2706014 RepID=UPI0016575E8A|nr:hypothetical protein [Nitrosophilus labii]